MFSASVSFLKIFHGGSFAKSNLEGCRKEVLKKWSALTFNAAMQSRTQKNDRDSAQLTIVTGSG